MKKYINAKMRCKKYRKNILELSQHVSALHIGGSFSSVEIVDCIYSMLKDNNDVLNMSEIPDDDDHGEKDGDEIYL